MSLQSQIEANDVPDFANEPGPGHYFNADSANFSSLGEQKLSKCSSAPAMGFPHTNWGHWNKIVISKAHEGTGKCREGHGFTCTPKEERCLQSMKMGTSVRPAMSEGMGADSPGPTYNLRDIPGLEDRPSAQNGKNKSFGMGQRFRKDRAGGLGPGQYDKKELLNGDSGRSFGIGRPAYEKVIRPGWEEDFRGKTSPGVGPPLDKAMHTGCAPFTMSQAERFPAPRRNPDPGPGHYRQDERAMVRTTNMRSGSASADTRRPPSCKMGKPSKKPRYRILLAQRTAIHSGWGYF